MNHFIPTFADLQNLALWTWLVVVIAVVLLGLAVFLDTVYDGVVRPWIMDWRDAPLLNVRLRIAWRKWRTRRQPIDFEARRRQLGAAAHLGSRRAH